MEQPTGRTSLGCDLANPRHYFNLVDTGIRALSTGRLSPVLWHPVLTGLLTLCTTGPSLPATSLTKFNESETVPQPVASARWQLIDIIPLRNGWTHFGQRFQFLAPLLARQAAASIAACPSASANDTGTALPIHRAIRVLGPRNSSSSENVWSAAASRRLMARCCSG